MNILRSWSSFISNISVRGKLNLLTVIIAVGVIALAVIAARMQYLDLYETRKASLQSDVELTYGVLDHYVERVADGTLPLDRAQAEAIAALETMRAKDDSSYFNIYSTDYVVLMHPFRKDLLGKDMKDFRSEDGVRLYHDQVEAAKAGGGYVGYEWAKPGQDKPVPKLAYAGMYKPWNWVISTGVYMDDVQTQALRFTGIMTLAGGVLVLLVFGLSWMIGSRIVLPLRRATTVADAIAGGRLDNAIAQTSRDEPGRLLGSMQRMQAQLQAVIAAQQEMERQHDAGIISYRMDQAAFPGDYGVMVAGTNQLVGSHIGIKMQVIELAQRYAVGDLTRDMPQLPGEKAEITETMATIKRNLTAISSEIRRLSSAAAGGDFSQRGDEERFQFDFRQMVHNLNAMMEATDHSLAETSSLLQAIARGDLTARMHGDFQGVFARMRDDANATVAQLTSIVGRIQTAASSINLAASEIATGNNDLSRRTEQQAANLEETAASMEELTSTVRQNAEHARQANQLAQGAHGVASQGGDIVGKVVTTMSAIEASSKKIADIISVIDGIAQVNQTVTQMDETTQQNAALVEEASAAARSMEEQANQLVDAVAVFRLEAAKAKVTALPAHAPAVPAETRGIASFDEMIEAHLKWKLRLKEHLSGHGQPINADEAGQDSLCQLGKWIHGKGRSLAGMAEYEHLRQHHATFHQSAGQIIRHIEAGQRDMASRLLEGQFQDCTQKTVGAIRTLRTALQRRQAMTA